MKLVLIVYTASSSLISLRRFRRRKLRLRGTLGEEVRDGLLKAAEESAYKTGNKTEEAVTYIFSRVLKLETAVEKGTELGLGTESAGSLGRILFKAGKDDKVCTGLCAISGTCETVALCCSTIKIIPGRTQIYIASKIISRGCIPYRNACAGEVGGC